MQMSNLRHTANAIAMIPASFAKTDHGCDFWGDLVGGYGFCADPSGGLCFVFWSDAVSQRR